MEYITILFFVLRIKIYFNALLFISKILLKITDNKVVILEGYHGNLE